MCSGFQSLDELRLEDLVNKLALLDEDGFDGAIGRVIENDAMTPDAEPIVAREGRFEGADVAAFLPQFGECMLECPPGFRRQAAGILDDLG